MILEKGNMWLIYDSTDLFLITANSTILTNSELMMGAGIAKEAKERFPELPKLAGNYIRVAYSFYGLIVFGSPKIGLFQTKTYWRSPSTLQLIMRSTVKLLDYIDTAITNLSRISATTNYRVDLNFPGIGHGGLKREDVLPIISVLPDNVHVWEFE